MTLQVQLDILNMPPCICYIVQ